MTAELESKEETENKDELASNNLVFRPFVSDPSKQARYERYLSFIKIGAKGNILPCNLPVFNEK